MKPLRPRLAPTLVLLVLLPVMIALGFWQLDRGAQKQQLLDTWARHRDAAPVLGTDLYTLPDPDFRRVTLRGTFDPDHSLLLDNRQRDGQVGVELLQPFHDQASGLWVLINRGWLPWPDRRTPPGST
jgi:cytochrome oxidase assembly protein ShyY1